MNEEHRRRPHRHKKHHHHHSGEGPWFSGPIDVIPPGEVHNYGDVHHNYAVDDPYSAVMAILRGVQYRGQRETIVGKVLATLRSEGHIGMGRVTDLARVQTDFYSLGGEPRHY